MHLTAYIHIYLYLSGDRAMQASSLTRRGVIENSNQRYRCTQQRPRHFLLAAQCSSFLDKLHSLVSLFIMRLIHRLLTAMIRYDTRCYFNVRSKADISQLNLPHGTDN